MWEKAVVSCFKVESADGLRKTTNISVRRVRRDGVPAEIRLELAPNERPKRHHVNQCAWPPSYSLVYRPRVNGDSKYSHFGRILIIFCT
jgi:hypothetical protein